MIYTGKHLYIQIECAMKIRIETKHNIPTRILWGKSWKTISSDNIGKIHCENRLNMRMGPLNVAFFYIRSMFCVWWLAVYR